MESPDMSDPLIIRADASHQMGVGHLMRCIALAEACQARGGQVIFLSHCKQDGLRRRIEATGIPFVPLNASHPHPLDLRTTLSLAQTCAQKSASPWIVLDGYHLDPAYQQSIQLAGYRLLVIDDMAHQPQYFTDILLNQNLGAEQLTYPCSPDTQKLLGAQYFSQHGEQSLGNTGGRRPGSCHTQSDPGTETPRQARPGSSGDRWTDQPKHGPDPAGSQTPPLSG